MKKTLLSLSLSALAGLAPAADNAPPPVPAALDRPAAVSAKAPRSALLALARAGERLVAVGERGIALYSDDHGHSWRQAATPTSVTLTAVRFVDAKRGWAVGHMGVVLASSDAGATWQKQLDGVDAARIAYHSALASGNDKALRQASYLVADGPDKPFFDLLMTPAGHGLIVGAYNLAFRTTDGGKTWSDWSAHLDNPKNLHLYGIATSGNALYIVGEQGLILRSTDDGQHFSQLPSPYAGTWFGALATARGVVLYGLRGKAFLLPASGEAWQPLASASSAAIAGATQLADGRLLLASQSGQLLLEGAAGQFAPLPFRSATPLTAVIEGGDRQLFAASLRGIVATTDN